LALDRLQNLFTKIDKDDSLVQRRHVICGSNGCALKVFLPYSSMGQFDNHAPSVFVQDLLSVEKRLLVAHHFGICVAHMGYATNATPLITVYGWRISICATHSMNISGAYSICAISILCVAHIAICATNT
jgi:hypothetical protein